MALPGVTTILNDGGLRINRTISGTRVLLLGASSNNTIPINQPAVVQDAILALQATKNADGTESELSLALSDALSAGAEFVEVMRISNAANAHIYSGYSPATRFAALSGAYAALEGHPTQIVVPVNAFAEDLVGDTYITASGFYTGGTLEDECFAEQLAQFCYRQTLDFSSTVGIIGVKPPLLAPVTGSNQLATGANGYYFGSPSRETTNAWVNYLNGQNTDRVSPKWLTYLSGSTAAYASAYFADWQASNNAGLPQTDDLGNKVDVGAYISVFAAPVQTVGGSVRKLAGELNAPTSSTQFNTNGAVAYAGLVSSLPPHNGTTNKSVPGLLEARSLSRSQVEALRDNRMVSMLNRSRGHVVVEDVTGAYFVDKYTKSDFHRLTTTRIAHAAIDNVRDAVESFIGQAMSNPALNAMRESIDNSLRRMVTAGALRRYQFDVLASPDQLSLGEATVNLQIVPAFELVNVTLSVRLAKE